MDVLYTRYGSPQMVDIWAPEHQIVRERELWLEVMSQQAALGAPIPPAAIEAYAAVVYAGTSAVDLESIQQRESSTLHDVKARLEEFNALAGGQEWAHLGLTSRDITENVELTLIGEATELLCQRAVHILAELRDQIRANLRTQVAGRTHGVPAQVTTLGYRFAWWGEQMLWAFDRLVANRRYVMLARGLKGAVGTAADLGLVLGPQGDGGAEDLDFIPERRFGYPGTWSCTGQIYPRMQDQAIAAGIRELCTPPAEIAMGIRLMVTQGLVDEANTAEQVGSTAMPHKSNPRYAERVCGLYAVVEGFCHMLSASAGHTWLEGDVSDTSTRRVAWPGIFLAADGLFRSLVVSLRRLVLHDGARLRELAEWGPLLTSGRVLVEEAKRHGREVAHKRVQAHSAEHLHAIHGAHLPWPGGNSDHEQPAWTLGTAITRANLVLERLDELTAGFAAPTDLVENDPLL